MQQLLWQLWQAIGWNGISAIAALFLALDALWRRSRESSHPLPPPLPASAHKAVKKPRKRKKCNKKRVC
jgi:hypothetical protein